MAFSSHSRYRNVTVLEIDGRLSLAQRPERLPIHVPQALEHVVVGGETLDLLAVRYYGREALWWRIADANPTRCLFDLAPGDRLTIPPLSLATATGEKV
jgi:nucleoid-associated protein YgaU